MINNSDVTAYDFDARDRLSQVTKPDTSNILYTYDQDGRRISQTVGTDEVHHVWDEESAYGDIVLDYDENDVALASYVLAGDRLISQERGSTTHYYLMDGQRNVRALSDGAANTTDTYDYDAYGTLNDISGTTENAYRYTGQRFDSFSELYNLRARDYDATVGRFLSRDAWPVDTFNPIELNRYGYTANNPVNGFDPSGNATIAEWITTNSSILLVGGVLATGVVVLSNTEVQEAIKDIVESAISTLSDGQLPEDWCQTLGICDDDHDPLDILNKLIDEANDQINQLAQYLNTAFQRSLLIGLQHIIGVVLIFIGITVIIDEMQDAFHGNGDEGDDDGSDEGDDGGEEEEEKCDYRVQRHGDMPIPRPPNCESHHGVPTVWMDLVYGDDYDEDDAPAILMPKNPDHNATFSVQRTWEAEMRGKYGTTGRAVPWEHITRDDVMDLARRMLGVTQTPIDKIEEYWRQFDQYELTLITK